MNCYAVCQKECDIYTSAACLSRETKEQHDLKEQIRGNGGRICRCGGYLVDARYRGEPVKMCFNCGEGLR